MLASLAKFAPAVLGKVADYLIPGAGSVVQQLHQWYLDKHEAEEKAEILKALRITEEKLNVFDNMFMLLGRDCLQLLERVDALEAQGRDATDDILREVLNRPELQLRFDAIGSELAKLDGRVNALEADVKRLDERYASLGAYAGELKANQLSETELADFREFRKAKQFQSAGRFAESEPILLKLANTQPKSAAVAVAQALARHDDPANFERAIRRAVKLRPDDDVLKQLIAAATVAVTRAHTPSASPTKSAARVPQVGDTLDGWLLESRLGGGGWGIVFRATKKNQIRALKVMRPDLSTREEFVEAFQTEAFKLNRLRHANVVAVERNGYCTAHHGHYFVMPLLDGLNLEQHLAAHGVPSAEVAMGWLTGLLDGLEHAHGNGLIHRDIKPQNVMILPDGRAVLIDFGIAGLEGVPGETQAIGVSKFYAPPELHSLGEADARADLFMLAATLFYALRYDQPLRERAYHEYESELVPDVFRKGFDAALAIKRSKRPANAGEMRKSLVRQAIVPANHWSDIETDYRQYIKYWETHGSSNTWLKRHQERLPHWQRAAAAGYAPAMVLVGDCCDFGIGTPESNDLAIIWFRKAADLGEAGGMFSIGRLHNHGRGIPEDHESALYWYREAYSRSLAVSICSIGILYESGMIPLDYSQAMKCYLEAADAECACAMTRIGDLYSAGLGVFMDDEEAMAWWRTAAVEGNTDAMCCIGEEYMNGHSVPEDYAEAMWWYRKAADAGNAAAMFNIGWIYHKGLGVTESLDTAVSWYERAVAIGDKQADRFLVEARAELAQQ